MEFLMTTFRHTVLSMAIAVASFGALAQADAGHAQHHPADATPKTPKAAAVKSKSMAKESTAAMDSQMKTMRAMHEKMMAVKTPEERMALMADHMRAMQEGMSTMSAMGEMMGMDGMGAGAKTKGMAMDMMGHHQMMEKRMQMMTIMMQMMMDRLPAPIVPQPN
jgi:hypothetical protein